MLVGAVIHSTKSGTDGDGETMRQEMEVKTGEVAGKEIDGLTGLTGKRSLLCS